VRSSSSTAWNATTEFSHGVRRDVINTANMTDPLTFDSTARVAEEIGERYGRFQDGECRDLKASLVKLGDQGVGRVLLKDFYGGSLKGHWQFSESADYLRELGALDESDPARVSVIVPNYVYSPSNCLATSSMYSACCIDECEAILGRVEREVSAPDADPQRILEIVSTLSSASVEAPRILPSMLMSRLDDVARHHGGRVPLHGRLFSQWLHHAFPRECPYPRVTGTKRPLTAAEFTAEGKSLTASRSEREGHAFGTQAELRSKKTANAGLQWEQEEELYVARWSPSVKQTGEPLVEQWSNPELLMDVEEESPIGGAAPTRSSWAKSCRIVMFLAAALAMVFGLKDIVRPALSGSKCLGSKISRDYLPHSHAV